MTDATLVCPRCSGEMRTHIRAGLEIDQCENCRGIFLDRGELERLTQAENQYYQPPAPATGYPPPGNPTYPQQGYPSQGYPSQGYDPGYYGEHHGGHHGGHQSRRRGFLHDLFDD